MLRLTFCLLLFLGIWSVTSFTVRSRDNIRIRRNGLSDPEHLWPHGKIPFVFDTSIDAYTKIEILAVMQEIEMSTFSNGEHCVMFVPRQNETDYVHISWTSTDHATTSIGRVGGRQALTVNNAGDRGHNDDLSMLLFIMGVLPEVERSDRDTYLNIMLTNVADQTQFQKQTAATTQFFGLPFDYKSVLLYDPYAFTINPSKPSTSAKTRNHVMGQSMSLSSGDVSLIQHMYTCTADTSNIINILGTSLPLECHFHTDLCNFTNGNQDNFDWVIKNGPTATSGTGPFADRSSGSGSYALAEARYHHNQFTRLLSPTFPPGEYCFRLSAYIYGSDIGSFKISAGLSSRDTVISNQVGSLAHNNWHQMSGTINSRAEFSLKFEATIGNGDKGDIAIDDVYVYKGKCITWN